ncbi:MAG: conserved secreted protein, partial [Mycobacterium sp.]|nr:conserved secreted protein [Mycobacterium sp.]
FANPDYLAIMRDCRYSLMGVWSENSLDRTVVVAMYGQPA